MFQLMYRYFKRIAGVGTGNYIYYWQSKGLSDGKINSIKMPNDTITPYLSYYSTKPRVELNGSCLKQDKITYTNGKILFMKLLVVIAAMTIIQHYKKHYLVQLS